MSLLRVSVVPIEFFEVELRSRFESAVVQGSTFVPSESGSLNRTFQELCDFSPRILKSRKQDDASLVAFYGSSACFIRIMEIPDWKPSLQSVQSELSARRQIHQRLIKSGDDLFGVSLSKFFDKETAKQHYRILINYVFSFYIYRTETKPSPDEIASLKLLSEPSLLDLDDMISAGSHCDWADCKLDDPKLKAAMEAIRDVDLAPDVTTFVTWASIVAIDRTTGRRTSRTFDLLVALETRLQMVWNRCFAFSNLADTILSQEKAVAIDVDKFFWQLARTYDDAQGMLAATSSSRANRLFDHMIETSGLQREIARLQGKVMLMEQFVRWRNERRDSRYRKTVEVLLFFAALSQVVPIFFSLPLLPSNLWGTITIGVLLLAGLLAIVLRRA